MASNPFDDFAQDFGASLPGQQNHAPPTANSGVATAAAGGAASFPNSFGVQQQVPPNTVMNQPQQFAQVQVSQPYPGQQLPASVPAAAAMNGTVVPPAQQSQQPPSLHLSVIGNDPSASGMYYQQPPAQQAQPPQPSSSALVPTAVDVSAPSPYASMLGPPPVGQQPNKAPSAGMPNGVGAPLSASTNGVNPFQAAPLAVAASANPVIDQNNPFAVAPAPGAALIQAPAAGGASPPFQDPVPSGSGMPPPTAPGPFGATAVPPRRSWAF